MILQVTIKERKDRIRQVGHCGQRRGAACPMSERPQAKPEPAREQAPPSPSQSRFDRELAALRKANAEAYSRKTAWKTKR